MSDDENQGGFRMRTQAERAAAAQKFVERSGTFQQPMVPRQHNPPPSEKQRESMGLAERAVQAVKDAASWLGRQLE